MTHSIRINALQCIRDKAQRDIDEIERQIAEEERPRVGDTVQIVPPHGSTWWAEEAVVISDRPDGLGLWLKFKTGASAWFEYHRMKVVSRAEAPKPRRWYTQEEFISFMFAHPVILVRNIDESRLRSGNPSLNRQECSVATPGVYVMEDTFRDHEYSGDGKTWQAFGVEV